MLPAERQSYVYGLDKAWKDSISFMNWYLPMLAIAESENDKQTIWALHYAHFQQRHNFKIGHENVIELETKLLNEAKKLGLEEAEIVAEHYVNFGKYNHQLATSEQLYAHILLEYDRMDELGFDKFKQYDVARLLFHSGRFIFQLEDYEKALKILLTAEKYAEVSAQGLKVWTFIVNHIQSIYQHQKKYDYGQFIGLVNKIKLQSRADERVEDIFANTVQCNAQGGCDYPIFIKTHLVCQPDNKVSLFTNAH